MLLANVRWHYRRQSTTTTIGVGFRQWAFTGFFFILP
jgi:hypothetical protein